MTAGTDHDHSPGQPGWIGQALARDLGVDPAADAAGGLDLGPGERVSRHWSLQAVQRRRSRIRYIPHGTR